MEKKQIYEKLVKTIVNKMQTIIGPVAITQANKVPGLKTNYQTIINSNPINIIQTLINRYKTIIGPVALTIAKKEIKFILKKNRELKIPEELK